jgi:hypothetical protein
MTSACVPSLLNAVARHGSALSSGGCGTGPYLCTVLDNDVRPRSKSCHACAAGKKAARAMRNVWVQPHRAGLICDSLQWRMPPLQDMAVETLLKICNKCKRKFVVLHPTETQPFVAELLNALPETIRDLKTHQVNMFYESVALMIRAESDEALRNRYLVRARLFRNAPPAVDSSCATSRSCARAQVACPGRSGSHCR